MTKKTKFDPRALMEQAVEVMRQSIAEPRSDGKASPKVGAVLVKPDGSIQTACRGELRHGDHAEFTLLERKNRGENLTGSILFATLEPCAPGARRDPKMGCAERIVLARVSDVYVGIADPDPTVDRKGIKFLEEKGIKVHMFDRDLQEIITRENQAFIDQALERAAEVEKKPKEVKLSLLEDAVPQPNIALFSPEALEAYRVGAKIADQVGSPAFFDRLSSLRLIKKEGQQLIPMQNGFLLFGHEPRLAMPQAALLATRHLPDGSEEIMTFDGPQVLVPEQALAWIRSKLPNPIDRTTAQRQELNAAYFTLVREAIVNAIVHRDYEITGAKCQLVIMSDKIMVKSPGLPVSPITLEQMKNFSAPMLSRNPVLHYVFAKMGLAEERGLGLKSMRQTAETSGLPLPQYSWEDPYLVLTIYQTPAAATTGLPANVQESLTESERTGWQWLTRQGKTKSSEYAQALEIEPRTAQRHLGRFVELGLVRKTGTSRRTTYEVI